MARSRVAREASAWPAAAWAWASVASVWKFSCPMPGREAAA
ncbi:MAG TPA: hypothetical protein VLF66_17990 [Thermoanaerobaculia bacterium]|nr:hypothetical protein [Thermoanaerobaculia bacterium]